MSVVVGGGGSGGNGGVVVVMGVVVMVVVVAVVVVLGVGVAVGGATEVFSFLVMSSQPHCKNKQCTTFLLAPLPPPTHRRGGRPTSNVRQAVRVSHFDVLLQPRRGVRALRTSTRQLAMLVPDQAGKHATLTPRGVWLSERVTRVRVSRYGWCVFLPRRHTTHIIPNALHMSFST